MLDVDKQAEWENPITGVADFRTRNEYYTPPADNIQRLFLRPPKTYGKKRKLQRKEN